MNSLKKAKLISIGRDLLIYATASLLCILILVFVMKLWKADLRVPFTYGGDALLSGMGVKGVLDNGWHIRNNFIGMPGGLEMYDFPGADDFHFLLIKMIGLFTGNWALVMNLFFLLTFPLTALCSLYVFRKFGIAFFPALCGSLLYAFIPYHFFRGEGHLFLSAYYIIPLLVLVMLWILSGEFAMPNVRALFRRRGALAKSSASLVICLIACSSGIYFAFFGCLFMALSGVKAFFIRRNRSEALMVLLCIAVIFGGVLINLAPTLIYQHQNGKNPVFAKRPPQESEMVALKLTQLVLPVDGHRVPAIARLKEKYNRTAPLINENAFVSLGLIGSVGFLFLVGRFFFGGNNRKGLLLDNLSFLNLAGLLYGTIGGFGALFAYTLASQIRSLNRICVFLSFFSLFAVVYLLDRGIRRLRSDRLSLGFGAGLAAVILLLGLYDQTTPGFVFPYSSIREAYYQDRENIGKIESALPTGSMVFQLPEMLFPETPAVHNIGGYEHLKPYLHSKTLRWSYGTMRAREGDYWHRWATSKTLPEFLDTISRAGFKGIYIDRNGYPDRGLELEKGISSLLKVEPVISRDGRISFFSLASYHAVMDRKPKVPGGIEQLKPTDVPEKLQDIAFHIDALNTIKNFVDIQGWAYSRSIPPASSKMFLILRSERIAYRIPVNRVKRGDVASHFGNPDLIDTGFWVLFAKDEIEPGSYKIGFSVRKDGAESLNYTDRLIEIK